MNYCEDLSILESLNEVLMEFSDVNHESMTLHYQKKDELFFIDNIYINDRIKHKASTLGGKWLKSFLDGEVNIFIKDEFDIFQNLFGSKNAKLQLEYFKNSIFKPVLQQNESHFPIFGDSKLFGVCIIEHNEFLTTIEIEHIKLMLGAIAILLKDIYQ